MPTAPDAIDFPYQTRSGSARSGKILLWLGLCSLLLAGSLPASAQTNDVITADTTAQNTVDVTVTLDRLEYIQTVLQDKLLERSELGEAIEKANEQDKVDLRHKADELTVEIRQLRIAFENLAIGGTDSSLFVDQPQSDKNDWRQDVALIAQPVLNSLKEITEKPRRIKELNDLIALKEVEVSVTNEALRELSITQSVKPQSILLEPLSSLVSTWQKRQKDALSSIEIAEIQMQGLEGNSTFSASIYQALVDFTRGRGLTLLMAVGAALFVWLSVRYLLKGYRRLFVDKQQAESRTRYRLAKYSVQALTFALILIAVFVVFYERHDVLLLGLLILLIIGLALSVRHLLPQYIKEARLLLNIGAMREDERVIYNGLPWKVESINMYTVFRNPELQGALRLPLALLGELCSRPVGNEPWFPSSQGDMVLLDDDRVWEVINQNPDTVELCRRGGQIVSIPTAEFYAMTLVNLSRGGTFGVSSQFGIDYQLQNICVVDVPKKFKEAILDGLSKSNLGEYLQEVRVELSEAGASSIDYWIFVTMDSRAARSYNRVRRIIQSACIDSCTQEQWNIPFPHVSVVKKIS